MQSLNMDIFHAFAGDWALLTAGNRDHFNTMTISAESRDLRFFTKEELADINIVVTHSDIVEDWFINK